MANNPELLKMPLARDGQKSTIPETTDASTGLFSQQYGWQSINSLPPQAGGKAVKREDFNGAFNLLGGVAFMAQKGFTFKWSAEQDYYAGCVVIDDTDGLRYECIADVTANNTAPSADSTHWQTFGGAGTDLDTWFRQPSTQYSNGAIALLLTLPTGWYLECTGTGGVTSADDLVITSPNVGDTVTDGAVVWTIRKIADTTDATTTAHGLMSAADKTKLNGIATGANNYSLPAATGSTRGGVTIGANISLSGDKISLTSANVTNALGYTPPTHDTTYGVVTPYANGLMSPAMLALLGSGGGIVAASLSANGYVKFANGLILQWGAGGCSGAGIAFPIAFTYQCFGVVATRRGAEHGDILQPNVESFNTQRAFIKLGSAGAGHEFYDTKYVTIYAVGI